MEYLKDGDITNSERRMLATAFDKDAFNTGKCCSDEDNDPFLFDEDEVSSQEDTDTKDEDFVYEILRTEQVVQYMIDCIDGVTAVLKTKPTVARILLNHFNWDMEKLYERYFGGNQEKLFSEAHIINPHASSRNQQMEITTISEFLETCLICFSDYTEIQSLACGHPFCIDCWGEYLTTKIMDEGMGQTISCAAYKCDILVDDQTVMNLIKDVNVKLRYQLLITNSFVECNRLLQWCPQPECNNVVKAQYVDMQPVICCCGYKFCFLCSERWHEPINCDLLKNWRKFCSKDGKTIQWIENNTKKCPNCDASIEKNGGCNHMTCTNKSCKTEFCWICLMLWELHNSVEYSCNRYEVKAVSKAEISLSPRRFLFYYDRYMNQLKSLEFDSRLYDSVKYKFENVHDIFISEIEALFLKKAVEVLHKCRQTLMHTYVFAYYVKDNNQLEIFVDNQRDLENATEMLSEYLEHNIKEETVADIKIKVQDKYRYCESRCKLLLSHVHEGYEMDWWEFTQ